jgi:hypothetical protein
MKMKIVQNAENLSLKVSKEELLNIWGSLLFNKSQHKKIDMPITTDMIKTITSYLEAPF